MDHKAKEYNQELTDRITQLLDQGTPPWQKPFKGASPYNPVTGTVYGGSNKFILMCYGFEDPRFLTHNGIVALGGSIKPDAFKVTVSGRAKSFSGIPVRHKPFAKKTDTGEIDEQGKPIYIYQQQYTKMNKDLEQITLKYNESVAAMNGQTFAGKASKTELDKIKQELASLKNQLGRGKKR